MSVTLILDILALICFALAAIGVGAGKINLVAAGLFLWLLGNVIS